MSRPSHPLPGTRTRRSRWCRQPRLRTGRARTPTSPVRTCAGCGRKAPQDELRRFHQEAGELVPGAGDGRGVYTCPRLQCFERAVSRRAFNRILRRTVRVDPALSRLYTGS